MLKIEGGTPLPKEDVIPTSSFGLNYVLNGGLWTGRFHLLWGNPQAGKTTMFLHSLAQAQKKGYTPVIIDAEGSYGDSWGEKCGIDLNQRVYLRSSILEEILDEVVPMMKSPVHYAFLIDSINAIDSETFYKDASTGGGIGSGARTRRKLFQKLAEYLHPEKNVVLAVSQQTMDLSGYNPRVAAKIGKAEEHWCTNIIRLFGSSSKDAVERDAVDTIVNQEIRWTIEKSKQAPIKGMTGNYWFKPQEASINIRLEMLDIAVYNGIIEKTGSWFQFNDQKYHGMSNLVQMDENEWQALSDALLDTQLRFGTEDEF